MHLYLHVYFIIASPVVPQFLPRFLQDFQNAFLGSSLNIFSILFNYLINYLSIFCLFVWFLSFFSSSLSCLLFSSFPFSSSVLIFLFTRLMKKLKSVGIPGQFPTHNPSLTSRQSHAIVRVDFAALACTFAERHLHKTHNERRGGR